ncbi:MAG: hypothetical protein ACYTXC_03540 [Nostoc sp.]
MLTSELAITIDNEAIAKRVITAYCCPNLYIYNSYRGDRFQICFL